MRWDGGIFNGIGGNDWEWLGMWSHVIPTVHITPLDSVRVFTRSHWRVFCVYHWPLWRESD